MKLLVLILLTYLCSFLIIPIYSMNIEEKISTLLRSHNSKGLIKKINKLLDEAYEDKNFSDINLGLTETDISNVKRLLLEDYINSYNNYYIELKHSQSNEEIQNSLYSTITDIIEFYVNFNSQSKPKMQISELSAISEKTIGSQTDETTVFDKLNSSDKNLPESEEKRAKGLNSHKRMNLKHNKRNISNKLINTHEIFLERSSSKKVQRQDNVINKSKEYVEEFLKGVRGTIHTEILDYSDNEAFFPKIVFDQGSSQACYAASASMLFSFYINIILSRKKLALLEDPLEYAYVAMCSTYMNTFPITKEEEKDLRSLNPNYILKDYILNKGNWFGVAGPTTVWIKHHLDVLLAKLSQDTSDFIPEHKFAPWNYNTYSTDCLKFQKQVSRHIDRFSDDIYSIRDDLKNANIYNAGKAFDSMESLRNQLLNHGPFVFRITLSSKGSKLMHSIKDSDVIITAKMCNRLYFNSFSMVKHYVIAVGFGKRDEKYYLKFKNSWGSGWGDKGYGYLEMDDNGSACNYKSSSQMDWGTVAIK